LNFDCLAFSAPRRLGVSAFCLLQRSQIQTDPLPDAHTTWRHSPPSVSLSHGAQKPHLSQPRDCGGAVCV